MNKKLRFRDEQHVRDAVERLTEYMRTYDQQHGYESYSAQTFIDDVLYGLGVAIEPEAHQFAQGFQAFKEKLADHLGLVLADLAAEREQKLWRFVEFVAESHDAGRHDGQPEPCPAHDDAVLLWAEARSLLREIDGDEHNEGEL